MTRIFQPTLCVRRFLSNLMLFILFVSCTATCEAQLFGNRNVGQPLGRRPGPQVPPPPPNTTGTVQGTERFLRDNRSGNQFVGRDTGDTSTFVGQVNAGEQTQNVAPAIDLAPRVDLANMINRPVRPRRPNGPLDPPLTLGFQLAPQTIARHVEKAQTSIDRSLSVPFGNQIEVSVVDQTAILRGVVRDADQARLAETIARMEPGIFDVQNELRIQAVDRD